MVKTNLEIGGKKKKLDWIEASQDLYESSTVMFNTILHQLDFKVTQNIVMCPLLGLHIH